MDTGRNTKPNFYFKVQIVQLTSAALTLEEHIVRVSRVDNFRGTVVAFAGTNIGYICTTV